MENNQSPDIIKLWKEFGTIKSVVLHSQCSWNKVVKELSTAGIIINDTHEKILDLYNQGLTAEKIADILGLNINSVKAYLPRVRPRYNENPTLNAINLKRYYKKHKHSNQIKKGE